MVDVPTKEEWDRWNPLGKSIPWGKAEPNLRMALAPWAHCLSTYNYITLYLFLYLENVKKKSSVKKKYFPFFTAAMKCNWKMSKADGRDSGTGWRLNVPAQRINPMSSEPPPAPGQHRGCPKRSSGIPPGPPTLQGLPSGWRQWRGRCQCGTCTRHGSERHKCHKDSGEVLLQCQWWGNTMGQLQVPSCIPDQALPVGCPGKALPCTACVPTGCKHKPRDNPVFPKSFLLPFIPDIWLLPRQALTGTMPSGYTKEVALNLSSH